jgi:glucose/arabinose dehydrogenase
MQGSSAVRGAFLVAALGLLAAAVPADRRAAAQRVPADRAEVALPGGRLPGTRPSLALVRIAHGFRDPTGVAAANDGSGRIFVTERNGRVRVVLPDGTLQPEPFLDLTAIRPGVPIPEVGAGFLEQGLWAVAPHPRFRENGHVYVHYSSLQLNGAGMVVRYTVDPASPDAITPERAEATRRVILRIPQPQAQHNGGMMAFGPDGLLYIGRGEGGWPEAAQQRAHNLGRILRIDVDAADGGDAYGIPRDNPFLTFGLRLRGWAVSLAEAAGLASAGARERWVRPAQRSWAIGLRNPYSFHFDPRTGGLFIADTGAAHWEEINWQPAGARGGENYGWPRNEAIHCYPPRGEVPDCPVVGTLPVARIPHVERWPGAPPLRADWGCAVIGLGVANYAGMTSTYLAGDWCSGRVWGVAWDSAAGRWQMEELLRARLQFTGGGLDAEGRVLAVNCSCGYGDNAGTENPPGALWRFVPADEVPAGALTADPATPD